MQTKFLYANGNLVKFKIRAKLFYFQLLLLIYRLNKAKLNTIYNTNISNIFAWLNQKEKNDLKDIFDYNSIIR